METPVLDFISSPWIYVVGLSLPAGLAIAFWLIIDVVANSGKNVEASSKDSD